MTAFFLYAETDCSCKYVSLFEYFARNMLREAPKAYQAGVIQMCKFQHSHCLLFRPASFPIFIEKNPFLFQNDCLGSLHVSLGNSHMLAKGTNFQDRQLIRKKAFPALFANSVWNWLD